MTFFQNNFTPYSNVIIAISNNNPAIVLTLGDHGYHDGLFVRLNVPKNCGMQQINGLVGKVRVLSSIAFSISIDTSNFDSFAYTSIDQIAQAIPVGEEALSLVQAEKNAKNIKPEF